MSSPKILVVGSINEDITLYTKNIPKAGETILANAINMSLGGKGANQAVSASRSGGNVSMIGAINADSSKIITQLQADNINTDGIILSDDSTGRAHITIDEAGENNIIVYPGANFAIRKSNIDELEEIIKSSDVCLLQMEVPYEINLYVAQKCNEHNVKVILNPAPYNDNIDENLLSLVDYYIPNETEFIQTINENNNLSLAEIKDHALAFANKYDMVLIVTLGSEGSIVVSDNNLVHIPAYNVDVVDTTAAGDSFIGTFATCMTNNLSIEDSIKHASKFASITIQSKGAIDSIPKINYKELI